MDAIHRGSLRDRCSVRQIPLLRSQPAGEAVLHTVLHRCENERLLYSQRNGAGRRYRLTAAGRARLRADRSFRIALVRVLAQL
jgi:hypothetical protein